MKISIIVPTYNEEDFIELCLDSIFESVDLDIDNTYQVIISDGCSTDRTVSILDEMKKKYSFVVLTNYKVKQVYALNQMLELCDGDVIIRCDAHAEYPLGYFSSLAQFLIENPHVGNAGYRVNTVNIGSGLIDSAIAKCLGSKFGVGSSHRTHRSPDPKECDTLLFGAWRREVFDLVGVFDESFIRGQDLEHNIRIVKAGMNVVQLPAKSITYYARNSFGKLFKMMIQYSSVKPAIINKHKVFPGVRSLIPLFFLLVTLSLLLVEPVFSAYLFSLYLLTALAFLYYESKTLFTLTNFVCLFCYFVLHIAHAAGWFVGIYRLLKGDVDWGASR